VSKKGKKAILMHKGANSVIFGTAMHQFGPKLNSAFELTKVDFAANTLRDPKNRFRVDSRYRELRKGAGFPQPQIRPGSGKIPGQSGIVAKQNA
jgi:hypothetical protein